MTYLDKVTCLSVTVAKVNNILQECKQFKEVLTFHFQFSQEMIICADCEKSFSTYVNSEKSFPFSASKLPNTIDFCGVWHFHVFRGTSFNIRHTPLFDASTKKRNYHLQWNPWTFSSSSLSQYWFNFALVSFNHGACFGILCGDILTLGCQITSFEIG